MTPVRFPLCALFVLLLLSSLVVAFPFTLTVVDKDGTHLPNTLVQVLTGNTVLYSQPTNATGVAVFDLDAGTYFIRLNRTFYPEHILLITLAGPQSQQAVMLMNRQSYILYGQVIDVPPSRWEGTNLSLLDSNAHVLQTTTIKADGYYIIPYLDTTQTYQLRLEGGSHLLSGPFSDDQPNAYYLALDVRTNSLVNTSPILFAPAIAPLYSSITATLRTGAQPYVNQSVLVTTPGGTFEQFTDANGLVHVNSAAPGDYVFTWANQTVRTTVAPPPALPVIAPSEPAPAASTPEPVLPAPSTTQPPTSASSDNLLPIGLGLILIVVAAGVFAVIFMTVLGPRIYRALGGSGRKPPTHETNAAGPTPSHPAPSAPVHHVTTHGSHPSKAHPAGHAPAHPAKHDAHHPSNKHKGSR